MGSEGYFVMMDPEQQWMVSLRKKVEHAALRKHRRDSPPTIFRVPAGMRRGGAAAYTPKAVSIGPYHRDDPALKPMDELKLLYLHKLLLRNPGVALEDYVALVRGLEAQARASYHDDVGMDSGRFVETMLLDGCFVVELFLMQLDDGEKGGDDQYDDPNLSILWTFPLVQYDLLMLENQIPYLVLLHIYHLATTPPSYRGDYYYLSQLAHAFFNNHLPRDRLVIPPEDVVPQYHHLLHFFHSCIMPERYKHNPDASRTTNRPTLYRRGSVPSATRLKEAGIVFRTKDGADSFLDVAFRDGVMEIPTLKVYDHTEYLFRNLIAFEQCFPRAGGYFAAYAMMMDCLISAPEDAALLHRHGCIASGLGDPGCAARLFNGLRKDAAADRGRSCYLSDAFEGMRRHCDSRWNRWRAKLMRDYFGNPWSVLSLAAALVLIFLTVVQALFSVLSLFRPCY